MGKFKFKIPPDNSAKKQPVIRIGPAYYQLLCLWKAQTGLPLGNIAEQCIDHAAEDMEEGFSKHADT